MALRPVRRQRSDFRLARQYPDESSKLGYPLILGRQHWDALCGPARGRSSESKLAAVRPDNDGDFSVTLTLDELDGLWCTASTAADATRRLNEAQDAGRASECHRVAMDGF